VIAYGVFLGLIAAERLLEVARSRRNAARAFRRGGIEVGRRHFRVMATLHALFLPASALEVWALDRPFIPALGWSMLVAVVLAQGLRAWVIRTLGARWNVRTVVLPEPPIVGAGPYRFVRHPNYVAVVVETLAIPLVHTAWCTALAFTLLQLPLLVIRIRCEEAALARISDPDRRLDELPRFVPRTWRRQQASPGTRN